MAETKKTKLLQSIKDILNCKPTMKHIMQSQL